MDDKFIGLSEEIMEEYAYAYKALAGRVYDPAIYGRYGILKDGAVVEITWYDVEEEQEIYFDYYLGCGGAFARFEDFHAFAFHPSFFGDSPLIAGDNVTLRDIYYSQFQWLSTEEKESYELYFGNHGIVTYVNMFEGFAYVAYKTEIIKMPLFVLDKLYTNKEVKIDD